MSKKAPIFREESMSVAGQSVKDRIWVFLYESLNRDIREGRKEISIFNEVDFYNICQGDLIKSKKDKYKPIKAALKKLIEEGDIVKVNIRGDPWKSKDEEAWYHFRTSRANSGLPDDYFSEQYKKMVEQDKLIIKLYNRSFNTNFRPEQYHNFNIQSESLFERQGEHFLDFIYAMHELIEIFNRPNIRLPFEERLERGMLWPKVTMTYTGLIPKEKGKIVCENPKEKGKIVCEKCGTEQEDDIDAEA